jgi:hypothetical protein
MGHLEPMEDAKREPYKSKGYTQNTKNIKAQTNLKRKTFPIVVRTCQQW